MYTYFRESFTPNLAFITDNGRAIETETFFDLCIENIKRAYWKTPEMIEWFEKRKIKIQEIPTYSKKAEELRKFFKDYKYFFDTPTISLSGSIHAMITDILELDLTS